METKTLKINIPEGYEIDKENSTFENIVFKKVDDIIIKWNKNYNGVEINTDSEHFILDGNPSYCMAWNEAMRFYNNKHRSHTWSLPTIKQLQVVDKYFDKINKVMEENGGFVLSKSSYWCIDGMDEFCTWCVDMYDGNTSFDDKFDNRYVRAVSTL